MASNPVFNRIERDAQNGYVGFREASAAHPSSAGRSGAAAGPASTDAMGHQRLEEMYQRPAAGAVDMGRVTLDDVIMKTLTLFGLLLVTATFGWLVSDANQALGMMFWLGGAIVGLIIGLVIAFKKTVSVPLIVSYAAVEGLFVGAVSQYFAAAFDPEGTPAFEGIVGQAVIATLCVFVGMFIAYRVGLIKVTDKFRRIMVMAIMGYALFAVINFIYAAMSSGSPFGFGGSGWLGIGISVFAVGLASLTLALDFDAIERAIAAGAPQKYSWLLAHGLVVTVVWLYIEMLRLLARLRSE